MKQFYRQFLITSSISICCLIAGFPAGAQISSDNTVLTNVNSSGNRFEITGGRQVGSNLFHSFLEFSVPTGGEAFFNNSSNLSNITNIISRVTGGSLSNIDGLIRENYGANLILINPNGINFGANAQLDIGGSFLASTANSLKFADGVEFSASDNSPSPRLTVSVPVGLQFGQNPQPIRVQGQGHNISLQTPIFSPFTRGNTAGLKVQPGNTLALVGGGIISEGGTLTAEGGHIDLGSVADGLVSLNSSPQGWNLDYQGVTNFQDIALSQKAIADTSGAGSGSIGLHGRNISIRDGSMVLIQTQGVQPAGGINVNASESLSLIGTTVDGQISSNIFTETIGGGKSGNISITTPRLLVQDGAGISAATYTDAPGGNLDIKAAEIVQVSGFSSVNPRRFSNITAGTFGAGNAGTLTISTQQLTALSGGNIASVTAGTGSGGNVTVNASKLVELIGVTPEVFTPSQITAGTGGPGNAGNVTINTQRLVVKDGGRVDASTLASGRAGSVTINAPDSVEVSGKVPGSVNPSLIISSANIVDPTLQQLLRVPPVPSGASGNVTINTGRLSVTDGAQVTVRNDGTGDAGTLRVNAGSIALGNQGGITAVTRGGKGGNIDLQVQNSLQMFGNSHISSDNYGAGAGGNLTIASGNLIIGDRSFISSVTFGSGTGANVNIRTADSVEIFGTGFEEFQQTFQIGAILGTVKPTDRGTGIFLGTAGAGGNSGSLNLETSSLIMRNGGVIFSPAFVQGVGGDINIRASNLVDMIASAIQAGNSLGSNSTGGNIRIDTKQLNLQDGATIISAALGNGAGGNVQIKASDGIQLQRTPPGAAFLTGIYTNTTFGTGKGGDLTIDTGNLLIKDGVIASNTGASLPTGVIPLGGPGGNVVVNARDTVEISGVLRDLRFPSGLGTTGYSPSRSGNLTISTKKLILSEGADASTATLSSGQGGTLTVNASESVELSGITIGGLTLGGLSAAAGRANLPELKATGASGDIKVFTDKLIVRNGARIDVESLGPGNAGNLQIVANSILLDNQGTISAATTSGEGGNISLQTNSLLMRHNSQISATAGGSGNGGNINITGFSPANFVALLEGSKITADAVEGRGGNISINTKGFFLCSTCQVSASSQLGIAGQVSIITPEAENNFEVLDLPQEVAKPEQVVAQACRSQTRQDQSEFTITGRGGLPPRPSEQLSSGALINFEPGVANAATEVQNSTQLPPPARGWYVNAQGVVVLASQTPNPTPYGSGLTSSNCQ